MTALKPLLACGDSTSSTTAKIELTELLAPDGRLDSAWKKRLNALGRVPAFQQVQIETLAPWFQRATALADEFGVRSEWGLAQMFDTVFLRGTIRGERRDAIHTQFDKIASQHDRDPDERERVEIIGKVLAENPHRLANVAATVAQRAMFFANQGGKVPGGRTLTMEDTGLRWADFRSGEPISVSQIQTSPP
jgi:hypothetical protein